METNNDDAQCFICLEGKKDGVELLRGICSCRGTSYENICFPCAVAYAKDKTKDVINSEINRGDFDHEAACLAWEECCNCKQHWTGDMMLEMAAEFSKFARTDFPHHDGLRIGALGLRLRASCNRSLGEREMTANILLSAINQSQRSKPVSTSLHGCLVHNQIFAHDCIGVIALERGDTTLAVKHFTKHKELLESHEGTKLALMEADIRIVEAKAQMPNVDTTAFLNDNLGLFREHYELSKQEYGANSNHALCAGVSLSDALLHSGQHLALERQLLINYEMSRQMYGEEHFCTVDFKSHLRACQKRYCRLKSDMNTNYQVVNYNEASDHYRLMCLDDSGEATENTFSSPSTDLVLDAGTPVIFHRMTSSEEHLNGKLGELVDFDYGTGEYTIRLEDEITQPPLKIKPFNIHIAFELPPKN